MGYFDTLSKKQKDNVLFMIKRMNEKGITNPYTQAGVLAVVSKESSFLPKSEKAYSGTSNSRIRKIFSRTRNLSESQLTKVKKDPKLFFDLVYDNKIGNGKGEGYKYRGRGLNQLTGRSNYENMNKYTSVNIVNNPDKLNDIKVATDVLIGFYLRAFSKSNAKISEYNMKDINDAKNIKDGVGAIYHANTGWGKSKSKIENEPTGGYKKAIDRVEDLYKNAVKESKKGSTSKKKS